MQSLKIFLEQCRVLFLNILHNVSNITRMECITNLFLLYGKSLNETKDIGI